jgi:hypothetical protein
VSSTGGDPTLLTRVSALTAPPLALDFDPVEADHGHQSCVWPKC